MLARWTSKAWPRAPLFATHSPTQFIQSFYFNSDYYRASRKSLSYSRTKYDQNQTFSNTIYSSPAVQNMLKKFEAFGTNPHSDPERPFSSADIRNYQSAELEKFMIQPESFVTEKDVRIARRSNYKTRLQSGMDNLEAENKDSENAEASQEALTRLSKEAAESWRGMSRKSRMKLALIVRQRRLAQNAPELAHPTDRAEQRELMRARQIREASRWMWDYEYRRKTRIKEFRAKWREEMLKKLVRKRMKERSAVDVS
ncbi:hypothetical protein GYMLUDRAFT_247941 [Collybiopsis luxurians FD-317 M1]|uniref:Uncharacterized protein n=1 Tax=Collybiopsis luxurians FD-317 M1 TaxID=944289 RepID=A0A0D0BNA3_9AGAR|nr:hypothetical protein GYMLUDRAFT_247941 [Collybiopsis luxurians FD-317 M1]